MLHAGVAAATVSRLDLDRVTVARRVLSCLPDEKPLGWQTDGRCVTAGQARVPGSTLRTPPRPTRQSGAVESMLRLETLLEILLTALTTTASQADPYAFMLQRLKASKAHGALRR